MRMIMRCLAGSAATLGIALALFACSGDEHRSSSGSSADCGDGSIDDGEACDGAELGGATCESLGFGAGALACQSDCNDFDRSACGAPLTCGNGKKDGAEICDGADIGDATCISLGFGDGSLACASNCGDLDTSGCGAPKTCGDGIKAGAEACDGKDLGGATCESLGEGPGTLSCAADCLSIDTSACECKPDCGGLQCGVDPKCGVSCGDCDVYSACQAGACVQVCDLLPIDADTVLDVDIPMFTLTGVVTLNGGAMPNDTDIDGLSRGQIELRNVDTGNVVTIDLKETGPVNYSIKIFGGTYDVLVHANPSNYQTPLPPDQRALIKKGLVVDASGAEDFDVKMVNLTGNITLNGGAMPNDTDIDGLTRGDVLLRNTDTFNEYPISLGETGAVAYTTKCFAGTYDVLVHSNPSNYQTPLPADQRALVMKALPIQASMTQDFDIKMVNLTGKISLNGGAMPNDTDIDGLTRGDLLLRDTDTFDEYPISLGETGAVSYTTKCFAGTYDVLVHSNPANYQTPLPPDQRALVMKALSIQASMTQDFDIKMVNLTGNITLNGGAMPNDTDLDGLTRGDLLLRNIDTLDEYPISLGETGPVTYNKKCFAGTYDVLVHSNPSNYQTPLPADQRALITKNLSIQASMAQDFDIKMVNLTGKITLNGGAMPNDGDLDGLARGEVLLRNTDTFNEYPITLGETGPVTYTTKCFAGTYDVLIHSNPSNYQTPLPVDERSLFMKALSIQASMTQDFDIKMVTLSGKITVNGGPVPNDSDLDGLSRGDLLFRDLNTADDQPISLAETGPVTYTTKIFAGPFDVLVHSNPANYQTPLPIDQIVRLRRGCTP